MVLLKEDLKNISVNQLKKKCKIFKVSNYSKLRKYDLFIIINNHLAILKIQRFIRNKYVGKNICPISMDPVQYPCFAFKPKGSTNFIYYNLICLIDYLLLTGDFRDPKTRQPYNDNVLKSIDKYKDRVGIKCKSVYKASRNNRIYKKKREQEDDITVLERCIDEVVSTIRNVMEYGGESTNLDDLNLEKCRSRKYAQ